MGVVEMRVRRGARRVLNLSVSVRNFAIVCEGGSVRNLSMIPFSKVSISISARVINLVQRRDKKPIRDGLTLWSGAGLTVLERVLESRNPQPQYNTRSIIYFKSSIGTGRPPLGQEAALLAA